MAKPDFLVIGAQKAGTTWLHHNLQMHPQVWLPPLKELHYFDRAKLPLIADALRGQHRRGMLLRWMKPALQDCLSNPRHIGWHTRFFLQPRSDKWYQNCFSPPAGKLSGDITPGYARLSNEAIARAAELLPDTRILYILRDPIERDWSQAAMYFSRNGFDGLENQTEQLIGQFLRQDRARTNSAYLSTIERWEQHFPQEQFHIAFFDQLNSDPASFLQDVCHFLQIRPPAKESVVKEKIHGRAYPAIPPALLAEMRQAHLPMLQDLHSRFDNEYTARWLANAAGETIPPSPHR